MQPSPTFFLAPQWVAQGAPSLGTQLAFTFTQEPDLHWFGVVQ